MNGRRLCMIVVVALSCGLLFAPLSAAGCVGPEIALGSSPATPGARPSSPASPMVSRGENVVVNGTYFHTGCEDTIAYGCTGRQPPADPESPERGVVLILQQGDESWELGTADAGSRATHYATTWQVRIPADVGSGAAMLVAGSAKLPVEIAP